MHDLILEHSTKVDVMNLLQIAGDCGVSNILFRDFSIYNLTSSGYPSNYPNDLQCNWLVNSENYGLILNILDFDLERGYDYLTIGIGDNPSNVASRVASLTGLVKLKAVTFLDGHLWMELNTDSTGSRIGFVIQLIQNIEEVSAGKSAMCCSSRLFLYS